MESSVVFFLMAAAVILIVLLALLIAFIRLGIGTLKQTKQQAGLSAGEMIIVYVLPIVGVCGMFWMEMKMLNWKLVPVYILLLLMGFIAYPVSRISKHRLSVWTRIVTGACLVVNIVLHMVTFVHFLPAVAMAAVISVFVFPVVFMFCIFSLPMAAVLFLTELFRLLHVRRENEQDMVTRHGLAWPVTLLAAPALTFILLQILELLTGKTISLVELFTHSEDMLFSQFESPPIGADHGLIVLMAYVNPSKVRTVRTGHRHGKAFPLSRQLMVCNAFEEALSERFPQVHKKLRSCYDKLDAWACSIINSRSRATCWYLLHKPVQWIGHCYLILFTKNSRARIRNQYRHRPAPYPSHKIL